MFLIFIQFCIHQVYCQETEETFPDPRIVVVGHDKAGKTTFAKTLLGIDSNGSEICSKGKPFCARAGKFLKKSVRGKSFLNACK